MLIALLCSILSVQDNRKCIFATDGILEQIFKCVATVICLIMAGPQWYFC